MFADLNCDDFSGKWAFDGLKKLAILNIFQFADFQGQQQSEKAAIADFRSQQNENAAAIADFRSQQNENAAAIADFCSQRLNAKAAAADCKHKNESRHHLSTVS